MRNAINSSANARVQRANRKKLTAVKKENSNVLGSAVIMLTSRGRQRGAEATIIGQRKRARRPVQCVVKKAALAPADLTHKPTNKTAPAMKQGKPSLTSREIKPQQRSK